MLVIGRGGLAERESQYVSVNMHCSICYVLTAIDVILSVWQDVLL